MALATTTVAVCVLRPLILKSQFLRNQIWHLRAKDAILRTQQTHFLPFSLLHFLHLHSNSFPIDHSYFCLNSPLRPLLRHRPSPMSSLASASTDSNPIKTVRVEIKGRVQGVFYRNWTVDNAKQLELKGWVRNRRDGSVEALFSGAPEKVEQMEQRCRRGPPDAMVTSLQVFPCKDDPGTGFERRPTV